MTLKNEFKAVVGLNQPVENYPLLYVLDCIVGELESLVESVNALTQVIKEKNV